MQSTSFLQELKINILGEPSIAEYTAFIFFVLFSMTLFKIIRYNKRQKKLLSQDPPRHLKFDWSVWKRDNILDIISAFMSAFIVFRFMPEGGHLIGSSVGLGEIQENMAYGVVLGVGFQYLWHKVLNKFEVTTK